MTCMCVRVWAHDRGYPLRPEAWGRQELELQAIVGCLMRVLGTQWFYLQKLYPLLTFLVPKSNILPTIPLASLEREGFIH